MVIVSYKVNQNLYYDTSTTHHTVMITTEHTYKNTKLVCLRMGRNLEILLNNVLQCELKKSINPDLYFYNKIYNKSKPKPTTQSTYEQKLKQFDIPHTTIEQEIVEEYSFTDKTGKYDTVQIAVIVKDTAMTASIDFKDSEQYENFVCPVWLIELT